MSLFIAGIIAGIALTSYLSWRNIVRPLRRLSEHVDAQKSQGEFRFEANRQHPEVQRLQSSIVPVLLDLQRYKDSAQDLEDAKQEFMSIASHELRTPLTSIKGSLHLLARGTLGTFGKRAQNFLEIAESEVDRMIALVNDILDMAKIESGEMNYSKSWFNANEFLYNTQRNLIGLQQQSDVAVVVDVPEHEHEIYADPKRLAQLLSNLVSNAIKHSPAKSLVTIGFRLESDSICFFVKDQGPGIPRHLRSHVFEKFSQIGESKDPTLSGTGLGLAISQSIATAHGSEIQIADSDTNLGSVFEFTLHEARSTAEPSQSEAA